MFRAQTLRNQAPLKDGLILLPLSINITLVTRNSALPLRSLRLCGCRMCAPYFYRRERRGSAENHYVSPSYLLVHKQRAPE